MISKRTLWRTCKLILRCLPTRDGDYDRARGIHAKLDPWQEKLLDHYISYEKCTGKGPRQATGKSFVDSLLACAYIVLGEPVIVGMPTLTQGGEIISDRIDWMMKHVEARLRGTKYELARITGRDNIRLKKWNNGGAMKVLSTDETAQREGFTATLFLHDEAQESLPNDISSNGKPSYKILADCQPMLNVARRNGKAKFIMSGIGGDVDECLIEDSVKHFGYQLCHITTEEIAEADPLWRPVFEDEKDTQTPEYYARNYDCLSGGAGKQKIFWNPLPPKALTVESLNLMNLIIAFDIGKTQDKTIGYCIEARPSQVAQEMAYNIVDRIELYRVPYDDIIDQDTGEVILEGQVRILHNWLTEKKDYYGLSHIDAGTIYLEANNVGEAVYDGLTGRYGWQVNRVWTAEDSVHFFFELARMLCKDQRLGVEDPATRDKLNKLSYSKKPNEDGTGVRLIIEHSDDFSALLVAMHGLMG